MNIYRQKNSKNQYLVKFPTSHLYKNETDNFRCLNRSGGLLLVLKHNPTISKNMVIKSLFVIAAVNFGKDSNVKI